MSTYLYFLSVCSCLLLFLYLPICLCVYPSACLSVYTFTFYSVIHSGDLYSASSRDYYSEALPAQSRAYKKDFYSSYSINLCCLPFLSSCTTLSISAVTV